MARRRPAQYWLAVASICLVSLLYVTPIAAVLRLPSQPTATALTLPNIALPQFGFPALHVPKLRAVPALPAPAKAVPAPARAVQPRQARSVAPHRAVLHVPVVTDTHSVASPAPSAKTATDPFAAAPIVSDRIGIPRGPTIVDTTPPPAPPPAPDTDTSTAPAGEPDPAAAPQPTQLHDEQPADTTTTPTTPPVTTSSTPPADTPASTPTPTPPDTTTSTPPADAPSTTTPPATPPVTPTATGWTVTLDAAAKSVTVSVSGSDLVVTVDGTATSKPLAKVSSLDIEGSAALSVDASGGAISIPITYNGSSVSVTGTSGATWTAGGTGVTASGGGVSSVSASNATTIRGGGNDRLVGTSADTTWTISGANSGSVGSLSFSGIGSLVGSANNKDTFVLQQSGSLTGGVDGGAGGFDTLVLDGHWSSLGSTPVDGSSGSLNLDGTTLHYAGLEPITNTGSVSDVSVTLPSTDSNNTTVSTSGGDVTLTSTDVPATFETTTISGSSTVTITTGSLGDTVTLGSLSGYTGSITIHGGSGFDTLAASDVAGTWHFTGINVGTYTPNGGATVNFDGIERLWGADTQSDTYIFDQGGAFTGTIDDGVGLLSVVVDGFVQASSVDADFQSSSFSGAYAGTASGNVTGATNLSVGYDSGSGFVGIGAGTSPVGLQGTLGSWGLAVVTDGTHVWHSFSGTLSSATDVGAGSGFDASFSSLAVSLNTGTGGTYLDTSTTPIFAWLSMSYGSAVESATGTGTATVSDFVHVAGSLTIAPGQSSSIDVATGLSAGSISSAAPGLSSLATVSACGSTLALTTDGSTICHLGVSSLTLSGSSVSVFVGWASPFAPSGPSGSFLLADIPADGIGVLSTGVHAGLALLSPNHTGNSALDSLALYALQGSASNIQITGIPALSLSSSSVTFTANAGTAWADGTIPAGKFGSGYTIVTGITTNAAATILRVAADHAMLTAADFVHASGSFSFDAGQQQKVDVETGLTGSDADTALAGVTTISATAPSNGSIARNANGSILWNLPVRTIDIGIAGDVFVGFADNLTAEADGSITLADIVTAKGAGFLLHGVTIGVVLMSALPVSGATVLNNSHLKFYAVRADASSISASGLPGLTVDQAQNIQVRVNQGFALPAWTGVAIGAPTPIVDFTRSFGVNGYQVPLSGSGPSSISIGYGDAEIGVSADHVLIDEEGFIYISGSFAFNLGPSAKVDVKTGLTQANASSLGLLSELPNSATAPTDGSIAITADGSEIWNLPVQTLTIGVAAGSVFVGSVSGLTLGASGTFGQSELDAAHAVGVFMANVAVGLAMLRAPPVSGKPHLTAASLTFWSLKADAASISLVGIPGVALEADNFEVRANRGTSALGALWPNRLIGAPPVVDYAASFSSTNGLAISVDTTGATPPVVINFSQPDLGVSADKAFLSIGDFVYVTGGFNLDSGAVEHVDVATNLTGPVADAELAGLTTYSTDPGGTTLGRNTSGSMIWNLPVSTLRFGVHSGNAFVGYSNDITFNASTGAMNVGDGVGVQLTGVDLGLVVMKALPTGMLPLDLARLQFKAVNATATGAGLVGIDELQLFATGLQVRVNAGVVNGAWVPVPPGTLAPPLPYIDFIQSFGAAGYVVPTDNAGHTVAIKYTTPTNGFSANQATLIVQHFVYISAGFSLDAGPQQLVAVNTGVNAFVAGVVFDALTQSDTKPTDGSLAISSDYSTLWNVPVKTIQLGLRSAYVFAGVTGQPLNITNGAFTNADLDDANAIGIVLQNANVALVVAEVVALALPPSAANIAGSLLKFVSLSVTADDLALYGLPGIQLNAQNITIGVNWGFFLGVDATPIRGPWPAGKATLNPPTIDWQKTYGPGGYSVPTDTSGHSIALTFTGPLKQVIAQRFTLQLGGFVYLTGSLEITQGASMTVPLVSGAINTQTFTDLGIDTNIPNLSFESATVNVLSFGASHVQAFVGVNGPNWDYVNHPIPDLDSNGHIVSSEVYAGAVGLAIDNLTLGGVWATPTFPKDPFRYVAVKATASDVSFVGIPGLTATTQDIEIDVNMAPVVFPPAAPGQPPRAQPPAFVGLLLPVINFSAMSGGGYDVPTGALNGDGTPETVKLTFGSALIRARSPWIQIDLFGVAQVQGALAFAIGPTADVTLSDGNTAHITTATIGATNLSAFVGVNGPYVTNAAGNTNPNAFGISMSGVSLGLLVGVDTNTLSAYVAGQLNVPTVGVVGLPSGFSLTGTAFVQLNLGVQLLSGGSAINFASSFPTDGGFKVDTGDTQHPVLLTMTGFIVDVEVTGTLTITSMFAITGVFAIQADTLGVKLLAAGAMTVGPDIGSGSPLVVLHAFGVLIVNQFGVAADIDVNASLGTSDLSLTVTARVALNTTSADQTIQIPNRLLAKVQAMSHNSSDPADESLAAFLNSRLVNCADGTKACYTIAGGAPTIFTTNPFSLSNVAKFLGTQPGTPTHDAAAPYLVIAMSGSFNFAGFVTATGLGAIRVQTNAFQVAVDLNFTIGPLQFEANGALSIATSGVIAHIGISFKANLLSLFDMDLAGTLDINTQGGNNFFQLNMSGSINIISLLHVSGSVQFTVANGTWSIVVPSSNPLSASFAGLISLNAYGDFFSSGKFDLTFTGSITLGTSSTGVTGTGTLSAAFDPATNRFSFSVGGGFSANFLGVSLFGISVSGSVSGTLGQTVTLYLHVSASGNFISQVWGVVGSVANTICDWVPWPFDSLCHTVVSAIYGWVTSVITRLTSFDLPVATFTLPGALASVVAPPHLASVSGGVLTLNVGSLAGNRTVGVGQTSESYQISSAGGTSVVVSAFGVSETYSGVSSISGNFGVGSDLLILNPGVSQSTTVTGGGNVVVAAPGTNLSTLPGLGGGASLVVVDGGSTPLTLNGASGAALYLYDLGDGTGTLSGTSLTGFDTAGITYSGFTGGVNLQLSGGTVTLGVTGTASGTTTTITASGGVATINVGNGGHLNGLAGALVVNGVGGEDDVLNVDNSNDNLNRSGTLTATGITGLGTAGITYSNLFQLNLTLGKGANTFTVASTSGQTLTYITQPTGSAAGTITVGTNLALLQGPITINGGGADALVVNDSSAAGSLSGKLLSTEIDGLGMGGEAEIDYSNLTALTVTLGGSGNTFTIVSTPSTITTTVTAGVGGNTVVVQSTSGPTIVNTGTGTAANTVGVVAATGPTLTPYQGTLTINGRGNDIVQVDGRGDSAVRLGSLSSSAISGLGLGSGGIGYSGVSALTLVLGSGNDTFSVTSSIAGSTTLAINGGSDTIDLSSIAGTFTLNTGNGSNTITVHSTNAGSTLTINEGTITTSGGVQTFAPGPGSNWVAILAANGAVTVNEGTGTDVVELGSNAATTAHGVDTGGNVNGIVGSVSVTGGTGTDSLYVDETGDTSSASGNDGTLTSSQITGLGLGGGIAYTLQELVSIALGSGDTEFAIQSTSTQTNLSTGGGNDVVDISSDAGANNGTLAGLHGAISVDGQGGTGDILNISDLGDLLAGTGRLSSSAFTGFGTAGVTYNNFENVTVQLGQNGDTLAVVSTYLQAVTTIRAGPGSDTINVSSDLGTLADIAGRLVIDGQTGTTDTLNVSDTGDGAGQTGTLTATDITGLGTGGIAYSNLEQLNLTLGSGGDTLGIQSTSTSTHVVAGGGSDTINVSSSLGLLSLLAGHLVVDGVSGTTDTLNVSDTGDGIGQTGTLTSSAITGLGTAGIDYSNFDQLNITLGSGGDTFGIQSVGTPTHLDSGPGGDGITVASPSLLLSGIVAGLSIDGGTGADTLTASDAGDGTGRTGTLTSTALTGLTMGVGITYSGIETLNVNLGTGNDTFTIVSTSAVTTVKGGAGNDAVTVNSPVVPGAANSIGALLTLDGGTGLDTYVINTFGNGNSTIDVFDSGHDAGANTLTINGTPSADVFLFRTGLVASLTGWNGSAYTHVEQIGYDEQILGGLTVNGLAGNDTFAFDDNNAVTTVNGGDGNDTFQVGQIFGDPATDHFLTAIALTQSTRGWLSNGVSYETTLNGDNDDDTFSMFHNIAAVFTNGDAGDDLFVIRTFAGIDANTEVAGGDGVDNIHYLQNAPVHIDGGIGTDTVVIIGTEFDDTFTVTATTVTGAGRTVTMTNIEVVRVDAMEGNDTFIVESTAPGVATFLYGGLGSDTFELGLNGDVSQIQGALTVSGGDDPKAPPAFPAPILLPGESTSPLPAVSNPNLNMIESHQVDTLNIHDDGVSSGQIGTLTSTTITGLGLGAAGVVYAEMEALNVLLGSGADTFTILSTHAGTTTLDAAAGNDAIRVGSIAGPTSVEGGADNDAITVSNGIATVGGIASLLAVDGGTGTDSILVDDSGDSASTLGTLTRTTLTGLGMIGTGSVQVYSLTPNAGFTITLAGYGSATFAAGASAATVQTGLQHLLFPTASCGTGLTSRCAQSVFVWQLGGDYLVGFEGEVAAAPPALTSTTTELSRTDGINYYGDENLTVDLGTGNDTFTIVSTSAVTNINGGPGNDAITVNSPVVPGAPNSIEALLTLDGGTGLDTYVINTFGNGDSTIDVFDSGHDGAANTLTINGTPVADVFLFRAGLVALLTGWNGAAYTHVERIGYDEQILGGLTVNGLAGNDTFAFDDNSAVTTVNAGDGNDTFQVGQIFGSPEHFLTTVALTASTRGDLSNGVSYETTLNGDNDDDTFSMFHNIAAVFTNGDAGDDLFVIRTFAGIDAATEVAGGDGIDNIQYVQDAPVHIDGGIGTDTVVIIGTEFDDTFTVTATTVTGAGRVVTMTNIEVVRVDAMEGNDTFIVESTAAGVQTFLYGGLGSDTFDLGLNGDVSGIQGALTVSGGDDPKSPPAFPAPILLPGESTSPLPAVSNPNLNMIESHQVDTLNVDDSGVSSGQIGTLTPASISGLGIGPAGVVYIQMEAVTVRLGTGADTFTILNTHAGTTTVDGGPGNDAVHVVSIAGPTAVEGGADNDTVTVTNGVATLAGIASLLAVDGGTGTDTLIVDDSGDAASTLGTLTQTSLTGLGMIGTGSVPVYSLTPHTGAPSFTITLAGVGSATFAAGATAAAVQTGLQHLLFPTASCGTGLTSRCAQSVFVWQLGGDYLVGFQGEVAMAPPALTSTTTDLSRTDGINYYTVENASIALGSGNDRFNVRGTSASTALTTGAGDDVVYVSDSANLGLLPAAITSETGDLAALQSQVLHGTLAVDDLTFHGSLANIQGALAIDEGTGSNTLAVSDRADTFARTALLAGTSIVGLAPAPITYGATAGDLAGEGYWTLLADSGLFGHGITVYGGSGGNTLTVTGTFASAMTPAPFGETLTSLFTGEGADIVTVTVGLTPHADLVVDGQGGDDNIDASGSALSLLLFGSLGSDTVTGGSGNDVVFGDTGRVVYLRPAGASGYDVLAGGAAVAPYHAAAADGDFLSADELYTDGSAAGGDDVIGDGNGADIVFGGPGGDAITVGNGNDTIFGDDGVVISGIAAHTVDTLVAGADTIGAGGGNDQIFGGPGRDGITVGDGNDTIFGDTGIVTYGVSATTSDPGVGDVDTINAGDGNDLIFGGAAGDGITVGGGDSTMFGDDGIVTFGVSAQTLDTSVDGWDTIKAGNGDDVVFGGPGQDGITVGDGNDTIFGDTGIVTYGVSATTSNPGVGDVDTINAGDGNDLIFGGAAGDGITVGGGDSTIFGDDGIVTFGVSAQTLDTSVDGWDTIKAGSGDDVVFGGPGKDGITVGDGNDVVFGDDGVIVFGISETTLDPTVGDVDTILAGDGNDDVFGGAAGDGITVGDGDDIVFGDFGVVDLDPHLDTLGLSIGGDDTIVTGDGNDVVFGGGGNDGITVGNGNSLVFGDNGSVDLDGIVPTLAHTSDPSVGGNDTICVGDGNDAVFGGPGGDIICAGNGNDIVFGGDGSITYVNGLPTVVTTLDPGVGGGDTITLGNGSNLLFGGPGSQTLNFGDGDNLVFGDDGTVTFDATGHHVHAATIDIGTGDGDTIHVGSGNDTVFGGPGGDTITSTGGHNVVFGDDGDVTWAPIVGGYELTAIVPTNSNDGAADVITLSGAGSNVVIGGAGGDTITAGPSDDLIFGDFGTVTGHIALTLPVATTPIPFTFTSVFTSNANGGGNDTILAGDGRNIVIGGQGNDFIVTGSGADDIVGGSNVAAAQDGSDTIDGGAGSDVVCGDNCSILSNPGSTNPIDRTLTAPTIYAPDTLAPNVGGPVFDPSLDLERTIVLFDGGNTDPTLFGSDTIFGGAGNDMLFGQAGNDLVYGDGLAAALTDGNDYVEGGSNSDRIYGGLGQDILIGGSSDLFGYGTRAERPDGADAIFGGDGSAGGLNDPGTSGLNAHSRDADVIVGDNGDVFRLVDASHHYLGFNYDNYAGEVEHIIATAVALLDYSPYGDNSYVTCNPSDPNVCWTVADDSRANSNIGGADTLHGEGGNDVVYGGTGADTIFGDGQDDQLYGNSGGDWISGGTGDDGVLADDGLLEPARNGYAEPLYGLAATTQITLGTGDEDADNLVITVNVSGALNYTAIERPFLVGGNDVVYGGLGNDFLHGGVGNDAMSGAEALSLYYDGGVNPLGVLASLSAYYTPDNVIGYSAATGLFRYFNAAAPFAKIMVGPGVDFFLNFVSATAFGATTNQNVVDDGQDVLFGDAGNDWLVGGTNQDVLFGGAGNDLLNADDNLDSTRVDGSVTYASLCTLAGTYASDPKETAQLCGQLAQIQAGIPKWTTAQLDDQLDEWGETVTREIGRTLTADQAATLVRLMHALKPDYNPLANDTADAVGGSATDLTEADVLFGGTGRDILIVNTTSDRAVNWNNPIEAVYFPWEGGAGDAMVNGPHEDLAQLLLNVALALGADPTRPEAATPTSPKGTFANGEPFGELGLIIPPRDLFPEDTTAFAPGWGPHPGNNPGLHLEGAPDNGSIGTLAARGPSAEIGGIETLHLDAMAEALLNRIVVRGQLTAAEQSALSAANAYELSLLIAAGWVANTNGVVAPTRALWLALDLDDAPTLAFAAPASPATTASVLTFSGSGDAGDTITLYDGTAIAGTTLVAADGTWSLTVVLAAGLHTVTATQTINAPAQTGLTSVASRSVTLRVYAVPAPPAITFVSTPAATKTTTSVTLSGTGAAGDVVTIYDGGVAIATVVVGSTGTWSKTVNLGLGTHVLTAAQSVVAGVSSAASAPVLVTVHS